jgi:hypothetical protein
MAQNLSLPKFKFNVPWFLFDITNKQLIMSRFTPSDISDTKGIVFAETPIPGLNYQPMNYGGGGNRKISFSIPLIKRNNTVGNVLMLKQFENLRNQGTGLFHILSGQFVPNPQVLFYYGVGSVPLVYFVTKCDASHKAGWVNEMGMPQYSEIDIELVLDEGNILYTAEEIFRKVASVSGMMLSVYDVVTSNKKERPY